jgi:hypothetical protein
VAATCKGKLLLSPIKLVTLDGLLILYIYIQRNNLQHTDNVLQDDRVRQKHVAHK